MPARLNPESPGLKRLAEVAREWEPVHLVARSRLQFGDVWLEPGESFHCETRLATFFTEEGLAERIADSS